MSVKSVAKWLGIAGATYLVGTAVSNDLFGTNFKTIGNWSDGTWTGGPSTDTNVGAALGAATSAASSSMAAGMGVPSDTTAPAAAGSTSVLGKIGTGLLDFAKSQGGATLLASGLQGLAAGKAQEQQIAEERRYKRAFTPDELAQMGGGTAAPGATPGANIGGFSTGGYLDRARRVSEFMNERRQPSVGGPVNPATVASYARGG